MRKSFLDTNTVTLDELLGNGKTYVVPKFQRDYSWDSEQWEDLYDDIKDLNTLNYPHYMGAIVLQYEESKRYKIVDGQQRITTLSIFIIAVIKLLKDLVEQNIDSEQNKERIDLLSRKFLGDKDPASLNRVSKLELNENNNDFFSGYIVQMKEPRNYRVLNSSDKLLYKASQYFYEKLKKDFLDKNGEEISNYLINNVAEKLKFIQIVVGDELNAYTLFETLNARGVELSSTDLLKNYIFSQVKSPSDLKIIQQKWNKLSKVIEPKDLPNFLRYFINSKYSLVRNDNLFKFIKKHIEGVEQSFELVENLNDLTYFYNALKTPSDAYWEEYRNYKELTKYLKALKLFRAKQFIPLLMAANDKFNENDFINLVKICMILTFRYNIVSKLNPNEIEKIYNKCAIQISNGEIITAKEAFLGNDKFSGLKAVYIDDEQFKNNFSILEINTGSNKNLVRYILCEIENQLSNSDMNYEDSTASIEHILPENPNNDWLDIFSIDELDIYTYRLGNYVLLEKSLNNLIKNENFEKKKDVYKKSTYKQSTDLNYDNWTKSEIKLHQERYAKIASGIWKIDYK